MNNVQRLIDIQIGNYYNCNNYDTAIRLLRCTKNDDLSSSVLEGSDDNCEPPVFACKFAQKCGDEHILALANEDGQIAIHNTECRQAESSKFCKTAHYNAIFDLAWMFGQMKLVSVSGDHTARLFDVSKSDIVEERIFHGHTRSVKTVSFRRNDPAVFATGSRDGAIFVWDTRAHCSFSYVTQPDRVISNSHYVPNTPGSGSKFRKIQKNSGGSQNVSGANSVTSLVFQDDMTLISCGAGDGAIKVWDLRKNYGANKREPVPKCVLPYSGATTRNGFTNLLVDKNGTRLYASCMDNVIYCYNVATYQPEPVMTYQGHQNSSFYVKSSISADGNYLLSGSSDQKAYVWNTKQSTPVVALVGHTAEVTCVAWCQRGFLKLVTCSDDMRRKIWRAESPDSGESSNSLHGHFEVSDPDKKCPAHPHGCAVPLWEKSDLQQAKTPSGRKRFGASTPHSQRKKLKTCERCQMLTPGTSESLKSCENCLFSAAKSAKRRAEEAELSPGAQPKRHHTEKSGARRLFGATCKDSDSVLATILEENCSENVSFSSGLNSRSPKFQHLGASSCVDASTSGDCSNLRLQPAPMGCINPTSNPVVYEDPSVSSPTANLPNFVLDGEAPHLRNFSPQKKRDKDWLTKIRIEQALKTQMEELSRPSSPKLQRRLNENHSTSTPLVCSASRKQKRPAGSTRAQSPLLRFFRVTNNSGRICENHCATIINTANISAELR